MILGKKTSCVPVSAEKIFFDRIDKMDGIFYNTGRLRIFDGMDF